MPIHFAEPPASAVSALENAIPRILARASVSVAAPSISAAANAFALRRDAATAQINPARVPPVAVPRPITAPVHVLGLDQIAARADLHAAPVKLWAHMLHEDDGAPTTLADTDAVTQKFAAITEGTPVKALGAQIRKVEAETRTSTTDYDLTLLRVPALYLDAVWLKGRNGAPDVVIPNESPMSPLTPGQHYTVEQFTAALKPVADRLLRETDPRKGG